MNLILLLIQFNTHTHTYGQKRGDGITVNTNLCNGCISFLSRHYIFVVSEVLDHLIQTIVWDGHLRTPFQGIIKSSQGIDFLPPFVHMERHDYTSN